MPLKASPTDQAKLLELQALDIKLRQLDHRAKTLPEIAAIAGLRSDEDALRRELTLANGALEDARRELGRIESDVAVVEARVKRDSDRLQVSTSVKDVAGLESELAGLTRRQAELEEIELTVMERVEELEAAVRDLVAKDLELKAGIAKVEEDRTVSLGLLGSEREDAAVKRSSIAGGLPADLIALYERQRDRYGFGASLLQGGVSQASGVKLNENDMAAIRAADPDDVVLCPDSSAILVRTAESGLFSQSGL